MSARASHTHMHAHAHTHTRTHTHSHTLGPTLMTLLVGSGTTKGRCTLTAALVNPQWLWISAPGERTENIVMFSGMKPGMDMRMSHVRGHKAQLASMRLPCGFTKKNVRQPCTLD